LAFSILAIDCGSKAEYKGLVSHCKHEIMIMKYFTLLVFQAKLSQNLSKLYPALLVFSE